MINKDQLRDLITKVLREMEPEVSFSSVAVEMLMMIAAHESKLGTYLKQVRGPALGIFQIEPATERDIFDNYLRFHEEREDLVSSFTTASNVSDLEHNLGYQIVLARLQLTRKPGALPKEPTKMAKYLKEHWSTVLGAATYRDYLWAYTQLAK